MNQLRPFSAFKQTAPYIAFLYPVNLVSLTINLAAAGWVQLYDTVTALAGNEVPVKSYYFGAAGTFTIEMSAGPVPFLLGLTIAVSSTQEKYTAAATAFDAMGEINEYETDVTIGKSVIGDTTTTRTYLDVWTTGTAKKLYKAIITEKLGTKAYIAIVAPIVNFNTGQRPTWIMPLAANETKVLNFGTDGMFPIYGNGSTVNNGCSIYVFDDDGTGYLKFPLSGTNARCTIKAWYL